MLGSMLLLGFLLGLRHALEADHVAAVAALSTRASSRGDLLRLAAGWGAGHTLTILLLGGVAILLGRSLPSGSEEFFDRIVGVVLVAMGADVLRRAVSRGLTGHLHEHSDGTRHLHLHFHEGDRRVDCHRHPHRTPARALAMGTLHGLAGSAALLLLALPEAGSGLEAMAYLAVFGAGSVVGMMIFSLALSFPLRLAARAAGAMTGLEGLLGGATLLVGLHILMI